MCIDTRRKSSHLFSIYSRDQKRTFFSILPALGSQDDLGIDQLRFDSKSNIENVFLTEKIQQWWT